MINLLIGLFVVLSNQNYTIESQSIKTNPKIEIQEKIESVKTEKVDMPFSASLSSDVINFSILTPTDPVIRTVNLKVESPIYGYSVLALEDHPFVRDTTCDNGLCSEQTASEWSNTLTYGFGYRCDNVIGLGCDKAFDNLNFYKHFSDSSSNQAPADIMSTIGLGMQETRLSYKINISGSQSKGPYSNTVTFIAIPKF